MKLKKGEISPFFFFYDVWAMIVLVFLRIVLTFEDNELTLFKISLSENSEFIAFAESSKLINAFNVFFYFT